MRPCVFNPFSIFSDSNIDPAKCDDLTDNFNSSMTDVQDGCTGRTYRTDGLDGCTTRMYRTDALDGRP